MKKGIYLIIVSFVLLISMLSWAAGEMFFGGSYDGYAMVQATNTSLNGRTHNPFVPVLMILLEE